MNMINCSENCEHQKDGYCTLENSSIVYVGNNSCWFFEKKKNPPEPLPTDYEF